MKSIFPPSVASSGASQGRLRQVIFGVGALVALVALAWFRAEVRSQFRSLLGRNQPVADTSATASAHARAAAKGANAAARTDSAAATAQTDSAAATATTADPKKSGAGVAVAQTGHPDAKKSASPAKGVAVAKAPASESPKAAAKAPAKDTAQGIVMREAFEYGSAARRDPFVSLLANGELRPTISDLNLMGILYDESGRHPIAIFRDRVSNAQYRVTNGQQLGRMRVARIKPKVVVFTIEEFGMSRQDSLVLGDSTKARAK